MKKFRFKHIKFRQINTNELSEKILLINLYITQALVLLLGIVIIAFQRENEMIPLFYAPENLSFLWYGGSLAAAVLLADFAIAKFVPEEVTYDGGINEMIFRNRPLWHIGLLTFVIAVCEELLFRGAIQFQFGPYWTSIVFAFIHFRYLRHWLMTGLVFSISYGLGWIYEETGTLWAPITAHFLIDFIMGCMIRYRRET